MSPVRRTLAGVVGSFGFLLVAGSGHTEPLADGLLHVTRTAAASDCPDEVALAASTLALGKLPETMPTTTLTAEVELDRDDAGYVARISTSGRKEGQRELRTPGETCAPLAEATSVALAILFDLLPPEQSEATPPPLAPPREPTPAPARPARRAAPSALRKRAGEAEPLGSASAEGGLAYGLLGSAFTAHVGGAVHLAVTELVEIGAGGFWAPGRDIPFEPGTVVVSLVTGRGGLLVWLMRSSSVDLGGRAELLVGAISGEGKDFDHPDEATELWSALSFGPSGRYRFDRRLALRFALSAFIPLRPQRFSVTRGNEPPAVAFETAPLAGVLEFGPELTFF